MNTAWRNITLLVFCPVIFVSYCFYEVVWHWRMGKKLFNVINIAVLLILLSCAQNVSVKAPEEVKPTSASVIYSTNSSLQWMKDLAKVADCVIHNEEFLKELGKVDKYTFTDKTPAQVEASFRNFKPVKIASYRTSNPLSKAIATTYATDKKSVYFNLRKNPRDMKSMANTSLHEGSHLNGWGHGDNSPAGKEMSVPYHAGSIAEKYVEGCL